MSAAKAWLQVVVVALVALQSFLVTPGMTGEEWIQVAIQATTAISVYVVANLAPGSVWYWTKFLVAALLAVLNLAVTMLVGGIDSSEVINLVLAALGALGVAGVGNTAQVVRRPTTAP